jgi:nucleoside 2-deoxyribosyltransferase
MKRVYLCGPISGLTVDDATYGWRQQAIHALAARNIETVSPMRGKAGLLPNGPLSSGQYPPSHPMVADKAVLKRDRNDVLTCDAVLACFIGAPRVSIGSMIEFGWADAWNKPVVAVLDPRHDHLFTRQIAAVECTSLDQALNALVHLLNA